MECGGWTGRCSEERAERPKITTIARQDQKGHDNWDGRRFDRSILNEQPRKDIGNVHRTITKG